MGLDTGTPHFLWKIRQEEGSFIQSAYRICVRTSPERTVWDSGIVRSRNSAGIAYEGESLSPCTRYYIMLAVWDEEGGMAQSEEAWFETGLMDDTLSAWEGASWIGAPEKYVRPETMGVFVLRSRFRIMASGCRRIFPSSGLTTFRSPRSPLRRLPRCGCRSRRWGASRSAGSPRSSRPGKTYA